MAFENCHIEIVNLSNLYSFYFLTLIKRGLGEQIFIYYNCNTKTLLYNL